MICINNLLNSLITDINVTSGSVQLSTMQIIKTYYNILFENTVRKINYKFEEKYTTIFGHSCRSLFYTFLNNFLELTTKEAITIAITPIQHSSFINIINHFKKSYSINLIELEFNENYSKVINIPDTKFDLIIVTHLWGKYLDMSEINNYIKSNKDTLLVEDVILGGLKRDQFNSEADILFHSMGFDKRPPVGRGGYLKINNKLLQLKDKIIKSINNYNELSKFEEIKSFNNITLLHLIYNFPLIQLLIKVYLKIIGKTISETTQLIRTKVPGFEHNNYLKKPSKSMIKLCVDNINTHRISEELFSYKNNVFYNKFSKNEIEKYFPWHNESINSVLPYTPILINNEHHEKFIKYMDNLQLSIIKNPTYKCFANNEKDSKFINKIIYLSNLYTLDEKQIDKLYNIIKFKI